jgi:predicted DNA-binding protein YlxM (UPF0122 family)
MNPAISPNPWLALESLGDEPALAVIWRRGLGDQFPGFSSAFLERSSSPPARFYPCPHECGCLHEIVCHPDGAIVGICRCESWNCDDLALCGEDLIRYRLSWPRLSRALCKGLDLQAKTAQLGLPHTRQIGSWSAAAIPAIFTVAAKTPDFRHIAAELGARLRQPFILLGPTAAGVSASSQELLANFGAQFFSLAANFVLKPGGALQPVRPPGELLAKFALESKEPLPEEVARRAFALIQQLDSDQRTAAPAVLTVFRWYCIEERSIGEIARKFRVSKATIFRRLELIRARTGLDARDLRRVSTHLDKIEEDLTDARAEHIHRKNLIQEDDAEEREW